MLAYPEIAARLFGVPLAIDVDKACAILSGYGARIVGADHLEIDGAALHRVGFEPAATRLGDRLGRTIEARYGAETPVFDMVENVGVIGVQGTLVQRGFHVGKSSGRTSYQGIQTQLQRAARDPRVRGVVLEIDSSGGEVAGMFETADMIAAVSAAKPTIAILSETAASAAYLMASAARRIIVPETGIAGSIGAMMIHIDQSKALEKAGVAVSIISSGRHKADGSPLSALSDDVRSKAQARVDATRQAFAEAVGSYRGTRMSAAQALATEADIFTGAEAVALGLADAVGNPNEAFSAFIAAVSRH